MVSDLRADQQFTTDNSRGTATFNLSQGLTVGGTSAAAAIQVSYNATTNSYTVASSGTSQTFSPVERQASSTSEQNSYFKTDGAVRDYLTLLVRPYTASIANKYVGMGYWQRNTISGSTQNTTFDAFVYGFDTPTAAIPHTGAAGFRIDAFGLITVPGKEPKAISGTGTMQVDFLSGLFQSKSYVGEYSLTSDAYSSGGSIFLQTSGHLTSGNGLFGNMSYSSLDGTVSGSIAGRFYGPAAEELGASFSASNATGSSLTGTLTGARDASAPVTQALTNIVTDTPMTDHYAHFYAGTDTSLTPAFRGSLGTNAFSYDTGSVTPHTDGSITIHLSNADSPDTILTSADRSTIQRANFTSYDKVTQPFLRAGALPSHVDLYKPGNSNTELALSYASFGIWSSRFVNGTFVLDQRDFFTYGLETPTSILSYRSGTGTYDGVAYGATTANGVTQDVTGTSRFDVNFGAQNYTGSLTLASQPVGGGSSAALGTWTFGDRLVAGQMAQTPLLRDGVGNTVMPAEYNSISPRFYGPDGEEIAGTFTIIQTMANSAGVGNVSITGATVAKRR
jgi:hypothetical protein